MTWKQVPDRPVSTSPLRRPSLDRSRLHDHFCPVSLPKPVPIPRGFGLRKYLIRSDFDDARRAVSRSSLTRHRRISAHDRSPVRGPRSVGAGLGRRHEKRQADSARRPEERGSGRPDHRRHLHGRHGFHGAPASEAAGRHRQGAGRGRPAGPYPPLRGQPGFLPGRSRDHRRGRWRGPGTGGLGALGRHPVRAVHPAQQEDPAGSPGFRQPDRRSRQAGRHPWPLTWR